MLQVNATRLTPANQAGARFTYPRDIEGWRGLGSWVQYTLRFTGLPVRSVCRDKQDGHT